MRASRMEAWVEVENILGEEFLHVFAAEHTCGNV